MSQETLSRVDQEILEKLKNWKEIISKYQRPNSIKAIIQLANTFLPYIGLWILMYFAWNYSILLTFFLGLINAFFLVRIFIIQHDCGHQSFLGSKRWNNAVGWCCSLFSTLPFKYWAKVHNHHHGHSGQLEERDIGDINFITVEEFRKRSKWGRFKYRVFRHPFVLFVIAPLYYFTVSNRIPTIRMKNWKKIGRFQLLNNCLMLGLYLLLGWLVGWLKFFGIQLFIVFTFFIIAFWFFYVQHQHEEGYMRWRKNWNFLLASIRGASYYKLPKVLQWLTGNIGFHHVHHLSSLIPNYNLEQCVKENPILSKFANVVTLWDSFKLVANKLWDEERKRMISFAEFYQLERVRVRAY